jgi:hypothetical protein
MKRSTVLLTLLLAALTCSAVTIKLRDGRSLVCDILAKNDTSLIIRTVKGVQTNLWRELAPESFKAVHPKLYARLLAEAKERQQQQTEAMKAKGMILVGGKWVNKEQYEAQALARVKLNVFTTESIGKYTEVERQRTYSKTKRPKCGVLRIKLDSLDNTRDHILRVKYTMYTQHDSYKEVDKDTEKTETIRKEITHMTEIRTTPMDEYREKWRYATGLSDSDSKIDVDGWDIKIWLDDTLIYEQTRNGKPVYHHVTQW